MMEDIWPKLQWKIGTTQHGAKGVSNHLMGTFTRAILMQRGRGSGFDSITSIFKQSNNFRTVTQLTTKIHADIFAGNINRETMESQEAIHEVDRGTL